MDKILALLQAAVLGLLAVLGNHHATVAQQKTAIDFSISAVQTAKQALQEPTTPVQVTPQPPKQPQVPTPVTQNPCHTDPIYGRLECGQTAVNVSPIVYLESVITRSNGQQDLKGVNRDSAISQLGGVPSLLPDTNPYKVPGFYPTVSLSAGDKLSISIHLNPNRRDNTVCQKSWGGTWGPLQDETDQITLDQNTLSNIQFNLQYSNHSDLSFSVYCKSDTGKVNQITPYDIEPIIEQNFDSLTVDYVK